ncbi:MAG: hypothetical protein WEC75_03155 [Dehalococcoidia bacterium]
MLTRATSIMFAGCAIVAVLLIAACNSDGDSEPQTSGPARPFLMGFSSLPRELNAEAYADTFDLAAENGEMVLIHRTPPWAEFLPGADVSEGTARTTASEKDAIDDKDLKLFFAIDPTDGSTNRDRLGELPPSLAGRGFGDPDVQAAFISYAEYVTLNYRPDVLALGVEMNLYYEKNEDDFENFRNLYDAAYDAVKEIAPETQVTVTFQYEDLQGLLPREDRHFADWQLLRTFEPKLDLVAISTYPSFAFASAAAIPDNYYRQLRAFTDLPIAIAEMGFSSAAAPQGLNSGTEEDQTRFLAFALREAEAMSMPFVVWFAGWDPTYAQHTAFAAFQHIGLLRDDDTEKPAWAEWVEAARRPYEP